MKRDAVLRVFEPQTPYRQMTCMDFTAFARALGVRFYALYLAFLFPSIIVTTPNGTVKDSARIFESFS